jgi:hypothetical protein
VILGHIGDVHLNLCNYHQSYKHLRYTHLHSTLMHVTRMTHMHDRDQTRFPDLDKASDAVSSCTSARERRRLISESALGVACTGFSTAV